MPSQNQAVEQATALMIGFAERTGIAADVPTRRYLWTDAFAVCNFLALAQAADSSDVRARHAALALRLVDQVHAVLGRYRPDDGRKGWLGAGSEKEGESHPTRGGLRIGKPLPERGPDDPFDERLEWDRDGQYFHYLTKWMHALDQVARAMAQARYNTWARDLAKAGHDGFVTEFPGQGAPRMVWKMSIDLSRPLVPSMGQHDPLDGLITCTQVQATASLLPGAPTVPKLEATTEDFAKMTERCDFLTADPLGLGGLLVDAGRVAQLMQWGAFSDGHLLDTLLAAVLQGLPLYLEHGDHRQPASRRLAFRELGLAIGLHAIEVAFGTNGARQRAGRDQIASRDQIARIDELARYVPLGTEIESFWLHPEHRQVSSWTDHRDINDVMLATSLMPAGCLVLHALPV